MDEKIQPVVDIAENYLSAQLVLPEGFDRQSLTVALCESLLRRNDITPQAICPQTIESYIAKALAAPPGKFTASIAKATPAVHGIDASIKWNTTQTHADHAPQGLTQSDDGAASNLAEKPDQPVDFYNQSNYTVVKAGDILGKYHKEVPGTEGFDVRGKVLPARTAKPLELKYDDTIEIDPFRNVVARIDGVLMRDYGSARISDTLEIDSNVDFSTGNIDFLGNVLVKRSVKDCFVVKAKDNIEVRGLIEAATLIAGKDLHAKGGFAGREQGKATVGGSVYARYLDAVEVCAEGNLCVDREIINCRCTIRGNIDSPRGSLIGGTTFVSGKVDVLELGASAQSITELHLGTLPHLDPLIASLESLVNKLIEERGELLDQQEMIIANSGIRIAPTNQTKLDLLKLDMGKLQLVLDRAEPALAQAKEKAESLRCVDVVVQRKLHPNAVLICAGYKYRITQEVKGPLRITVNKRGQLEIQRGDSKPALLSAEAELRTAA